jgi:hypothetical protein
MYFRGGGRNTAAATLQEVSGKADTIQRMEVRLERLYNNNIGKSASVAEDKALMAENLE